MLRNRDGFGADGRRLYWFDGGGGGGGGGETTSTTQVSNFSPEEVARRTAMMDEGKAIYDRTKNLFAQFPGAQIAPPGAATVGAEQGLSNLAATTNASVVPNIADALNYNLTAAKDVESNPFLKGAVDAAVRPLNENYTQAGGTLSQIRSAAGLAEQGGGSRQGIAEGIAQRSLNNSISDVTSKIGSEAYGQGLKASGQAAATSGMAMSGMATPTTWQAAVGDAADTRAQQTENRAADARLWDMNADWIPFQNYANTVLGAGSSGSSSTATNPSYEAPGPSPLQNLATLGGIGGSVAAMSTAGF